MLAACVIGSGRGGGGGASPLPPQACSTAAKIRTQVPKRAIFDTMQSETGLKPRFACPSRKVCHWQRKFRSTTIASTPPKYRTTFQSGYNTDQVSAVSVHSNQMPGTCSATQTVVTHCRTCRCSCHHRYRQRDSRRYTAGGSQSRARSQLCIVRASRCTSGASLPRGTYTVPLAGTSSWMAADAV